MIVRKGKGRRKEIKKEGCCVDVGRSRNEIGREGRRIRDAVLRKEWQEEIRK